MVHPDRRAGWCVVGMFAVLLLAVARPSTAAPTPEDAPQSATTSAPTSAPRADPVPVAAPSSRGRLPYLPGPEAGPGPRRYVLGAAYVLGIWSLTSGLLAGFFEVERANILGSAPVTSCGPCSDSMPSFCGTLYERTAQRNTAVDMAAAMGLSAVGILGLVVVFDTANGHAPWLAPSAGKDSAGFVLGGAW